MLNRKITIKIEEYKYNITKSVVLSNECQIYRKDDILY